MAAGWVWVLVEPTCRKLSAGWLERSGKLGEDPGVLPHCEDPRGWGVPLCGSSLTS